MLAPACSYGRNSSSPATRRYLRPWASSVLGFRSPGRRRDGHRRCPVRQRKNPFGMNPDDPDGQDDVLISSPELHLPSAGRSRAAPLHRRPARLRCTAVPGQDDLVPGSSPISGSRPLGPENSTSSATNYCGTGHFVMRAASWWRRDRLFGVLSSHPTFGKTSAQVPGDAATGKPLYAVCAACHGLQAEGNPALNAPKLSGQGDWYLKRQLRNFKNGAGDARKRRFR